MSGNRDELLARRRALQLRQQRDAQRNRIARELAALDQAGASYELIWPDAVNAIWIGQRFPQMGSRIDWSAVPDVSVQRWHDGQDREQLCRQLLRHYAAEETAPILAVWGDAETPALCMTAAECARHCAILLDADFELWLSSTSAAWLMEWQAEGVVYAGRLPPQS
ncbi:hypothetical protein HPT27_05215 [Permianibacter sp. IMCC34836]|uniref:hypothetical protein n=1 Tax=Permianibacter fluminis TaxID=2738515 RepID=UPI00155587DF|nr:hypothetical protein [Permianibacter fluminis]NQD36417.1 hypothetical protein [Permianibacter fluminis]